MTSDVVLSGIRPEPLSSYLAGLGIHRLVSEQLDGEARAAWQADRLVLRTTASTEDLVAFFLDAYRPTPVIAPWNGRSGFRLDQNRESERVVRRFENGDGSRLEPLRATIAAARRAHAQATAAGWDTKRDKVRWVTACRNTFPDAALAWLDAVVVLTDNDVRFPPLVGGSGGVLGSMDLGVNMLFRLEEVLRLRVASEAAGRGASEAWLRSLFAGQSSSPLLRVPIGQFDAGSAGGVNSSPLGAMESLVNPWEYVLLIEGLLPLASGAARRMGSGASGTAAMPFTVAPSMAGSTVSAERERTSGEFWAPLWSRFATSRELARLLSEGRSSWRGRQARTGLDFARAISTLGVDRGIDGFVRHSFVERLGLSMIAVGVDRLTVRAVPGATALQQLDQLTGRLHGVTVPASVTRDLRALEEAQYRAVRHPNAAAYAAVLGLVSRLERRIGRSRAALEHAPDPIHSLHAAEWLTLCEDGSPEFELAAALASRHEGTSGVSALRCLLHPIFVRNGKADWTRLPATVEGFGQAAVVDRLSHLLVTRTIQLGSPDGAPAGDVPSDLGWRSLLPASVEAIALLAEGRLDEERLEALLSGLMLLDWSERPGRQLTPPTGTVIPPALAVLAPFFHGRPLRGRDAEVVLRPRRTWPRRLAGRRVVDVVRDALHRLRVARLEPAIHAAEPIAVGVDGSHIGAALLCPMTSSAACALLEAVVPVRSAESIPSEVT